MFFILNRSADLPVGFSSNGLKCVCLFASYSYLINYRLQGNSQVTLSNNLHHVINAARCQRVATEYSVSLPGQTNMYATNKKSKFTGVKIKVKCKSPLSLLQYRISFHTIFGCGCFRNNCFYLGQWTWRHSLSVLQLQCCHGRDKRHESIVIEQQSNRGQNGLVSLSADVSQDVSCWCWNGLEDRGENKSAKTELIEGLSVYVTSESTGHVECRKKTHTCLVGLLLVAQTVMIKTTKHTFYEIPSTCPFQDKQETSLVATCKPLEEVIGTSRLLMQISGAALHFR